MSKIQENTPESKSIVEVLEFCKEQALPARTVGKWVWIKFAEKPNAGIRQALKDFGFHWAKRRQQWCHNCGHSSRPARNYRPWDRYQTKSLDESLRLAVSI